MTSQEERPLAQMDESSTARHEAAEVAIQAAILEVAQAYLDGERPVVVDALDTALLERGIGLQPRPWVEAVAESIIEGRPYVESAKALQTLAHEEHARADQEENGPRDA